MKSSRWLLFVSAGLCASFFSCSNHTADYTRNEAEPDSRLFGTWEVSDRWVPSGREQERQKAAQREKLIKEHKPIPRDLEARNPLDLRYRRVQIFADRIAIYMPDRADMDNFARANKEFQCKILSWGSGYFQAGCKGRRDQPDQIFSFSYAKEGGEIIPRLSLRQKIHPEDNLIMKLRKLEST